MSSPTVLVDASRQREFRLVRCIGEGGFGEVYVARMRTAGGLDQRVAVKLLRAEVNGRSAAVDRLRDEAKVLASLSHPVILAAHDLVVLGDRIALVTEFVEGQDLRECLFGRDPLPLGAVVDVVGQVAGALATAWDAAGIVHRDVKPENIRIGRHGNVKLLDFGIAKSADSTGRTKTNVVVGSVRYLAPERFERAGRVLSPASDVFALGCVLYEGATGFQLYLGLELVDVLALSVDRAAYEAFVAERVAPVEPPEVRELLARMLVRDPDARIGAAEVAVRAEALAAASPTESLRAWCRRRRWPETGDEGERGATLEPLPATSLGGAGASTPDGAAPARVSNAIAADDTGSQRGGEAPITHSEVERLVRSGERAATFAHQISGAAALPIVGAAAMMGVGLLAAAALAALAIGGALWWTADAPPADEPLAPIQLATRPPRAEPATPAPAPEPARPPVAANAPDPAPDPAPAAPAPAAAPSPAAVRSADGRAIELRAGGRAYRAGEPVPPGSYEVWADFGHGLDPAGSLSVGQGDVVELVCKVIRRECVPAGRTP